MENFVLDTSAIITLQTDEPGADEVEAILRRVESGKARAFASFMTFMEVLYCRWRADGKAAAHRAYLELTMLPIERVNLSEPLIFLAGEIKATHSLSLGDSWIAATALEKQATLVHKDPEFEPLQDRLILKALPYK